MRTPTEQFHTWPYNTDKYSLGYLEHFYDGFFQKNHVDRLLEIGVRGGGSVRLWKDLFPSAEIIGVDVVKCDPIPDVTIYQLDAYKSIDYLGKEPFDLIIDDGPHTLESQLLVLELYKDIVKPGGNLVIEDIISKDYLMPLKEKAEKLYRKIEIHDMTGLQRTPQLLHRWRNGLFILQATR
jgi:23S rRNA U2552 (ribose-2'-O)-methylase RlmE/FtsJ